MLKASSHPGRTGSRARLRAVIIAGFLLVLALPAPPASGAIPPLPARRWLYLQTGLAPAAHFEQTMALLERVAAEGYNGVVFADYKSMLWDDLPPGYRTRWREMREVCTRLKLELIVAVMPMGYSNSLLYRDPNLAEGLPVREAPFKVEGGTLRPHEAIPFSNGGFERFRNGKPEGWSFADEPGRITHQDTSIRSEGASSLRMQDVARFEPEHRHARVCQKLALHPFRYYHVSAAIKTRDWTAGETRIMVLGDKGRPLTFQTSVLAKTQDWKRLNIAFNTLDSSSVSLYLGTWDGNTGTLWWDDVRVESAGFMNILRRPGTPLRITSEDGRTVYDEGRDFTPVTDPKLGKDPWSGDYTAWHPPPAVTLPPGSRIKEGQVVLASYFHPAIIYEGQVTCCMNEPKVYDILTEQAKQIREALHPDGYMMSHDEIRVQGWDHSCVRSGHTPAQTLAENVRRCVWILRTTDPGKAIYVWSDMFDPNHNARKTGTYYLVKGEGPWYGAWEGLPSDVTIVNWQMNARTRRDTIRHFSNRGHRQILAGFYDGSPDMITSWLKDADGIPGVDGVMYTTWQRNYSSTKAFLNAAQ